MSENQAIYGGATSVEDLAKFIGNPDGWEMTKKAIYIAAAKVVERQECSMYTAFSILETRNAEKAKENNV